MASMQKTNIFQSLVWKLARKRSARRGEFFHLKVEYGIQITNRRDIQIELSDSFHDKRM